MFPTRKKFQFQVTPSDRELWAIGMVAVQWSLLENWMNTCVIGLVQFDPEARKVYDQTHSLEARIEQWRHLAKTEMLEPYRSSMLALINRVAETKQMRDRIIHGTWSSNDPVATVTMGGKPKHPFQWRLNYGKIKEVAHRIDSMMIDIMSFLATVAPDKSNVTGETALRHTLRRQDRQ